MRIQANNACYRAENACGQSKRYNKARHVSKKESHFLRPTLVDRADVHWTITRSQRRRLLRLRCRLCSGASVHIRKHNRKDLWRAVRLRFTALNVCLVSCELGANPKAALAI